jgi:cytochrome d ubiquinol oxidase subunit I
MDALILSRLQFAAATYFHFLFVPLTLGLSILIAIMETIYVKRRDEVYLRMAKFWGKLFLINFALGVVTGITLEFQFGTNWSRYSRYVGDIFGSLLAVEATVAFFLESTFIAIWFFGWKRLKPGLHAACIWLVAIASNVSAFWILMANGWMQHPVGYTLGVSQADLPGFWTAIQAPLVFEQYMRAELVSFGKVLTNTFGHHQVIHTLSGAYILSGFVVMAVSAWHLLKKSQVRFFSRSFKFGMYLALIFSIVAVVQGHIQGAEVAATQPAKLAAMEAAQWKVKKRAPMVLFALPGQNKNVLEISAFPGLLSLLAFHDPNAPVRGLHSFPPEDRPPVFITFWSFRIMVGLGFLFVLLSTLAWLWRNRMDTKPWLLKILVWAAPLPYIANLLGWTVAEVGRQPWIVYGVMRTSNANSPLATSQVAVSLAAFIIVYGLLGLAAFYLIFKHARRGPEPAAAQVEAGG